MRGGKREGAGRKVGWRKGFSEQRPARHLAAFDDEWAVIKNFMYFVREVGADKAQTYLDAIKEVNSNK